MKNVTKTGKSSNHITAKALFSWFSRYFAVPVLLGSSLLAFLLTGCFINRNRLTGINAPESVAEDESRNTKEGRVSSKLLKELLKDMKTAYIKPNLKYADDFRKYEKK